MDQVAQIISLQPGDVITSTTGEIASGVIRTFTWSDASHAIIYIGNRQVVESVPPMSRRTFLRAALEDSTYANAWTMSGLTSRDRKQICDFALQHIGESYSGWSATNSGVGLAAGGTPGSFCSSLVAAAYDRVGMPITKSGYGATNPGMIEKRSTRNPKLIWLGWLKNPTIPGCGRGL